MKGINMLEQKNSNKQGDVGLGAAIAYLTSMGYTVAVPLTESQGYDLIIEIDKELKKVEVKTTRYKEYKSYRVNLKTMGGNQSFNTIKNFDPNSVDFLFVLIEAGDKYFIPASAITTKTQIALNENFEKYKVE
jgi:hypothetical protein